MYKMRIKKLFLYIILTLSAAIFILAFSSFFYAKYHKEKQLEFLEGDYVQVEFTNKNVKIQDLQKVLQTLDFKQCFLDYEWSGTKATAFTDSFFKQISLVNRKRCNFKENDNIAVVNKEWKSRLCYKKGELEYLYRQGVEYRVIGTYMDHKNDTIYEVPCYLNMNAVGMQENGYYDKILIVPQSTEDVINLEKSISKIYPDAQIGIVREKMDYLSLGDTQAVLIGICGFLLSLSEIKYLKKPEKAASKQNCLGSGNKMATFDTHSKNDFISI